MSHTLSKDTLLDITHEALLRNWDKLQQWAWEEHEREIILREMLAQLDKWLKNNRDTQYLLSAGSLSYFEKWWTGIEVNKAMWMRRYLDGGIRHDDLEDKERKTQNAKRKKQEIEEYLADSRKYHNRKKRIQQIAVGIICLLLVAAVGGLIYSINLQKKISVTSLSNSIATKAYRTLEKDPTLAFRLAEQAYKIAPEPLVKEVLMASYGEMPFYQVMRGHTEPIVNAKYSPDGKYIVTASLDNKIILWDNLGKMIYKIDKHDALVSGSRTDVVNFSPDSKFIVSAGDDSTARLWEVSTGKCMAVMKHKRAVSSAVFSPDGTKILTASADKTAKLWDMEGKELVVFRGHTKWVKLAKFSPDGTKILTASGDSTARLWDLEGNKLYIFRGHDGVITDFKFSKGGSLIVTASMDETVKVWSINGKLLDNFKSSFGLIRFIDFSNDSNKIIIGGGENLFQKIEINSHLITDIRGHKSGFWSINFSPDGRQILTASDDGTARLWDLSGTELMVLKGHTDQVMSANFSPDGNYVVTASGDKTARVWNIKPKENPVLKGHTAEVFDANFSSDGKRIITTGWDYTARVWETKGFQILILNHSYYANDIAEFAKNNFNFLTADGEALILWDSLGNRIISMYGHSSYPNGVSFSEDKKFILSYSKDEEKSILWDINGKKLKEFDNYLVCSFFKDHFRIIVISNDSSAKIINTEGKVITNFIGHKGNVSDIDFHDSRIITSSDDSTARIWELSGKCLHILKGHTAGLTNSKYSPDGNHILTVSQDNTIGIWDNTGNSISKLKGHNDIIQDANFSPDSKSIVTSSNDNTVRLWDISGKEIQVYTNHKSAVSKAKFSPNGKYILSSSYDHTARIMPISVEMVLDKINKEKVRGEVMELEKEELEVFGVRNIP